MQYDGKLRLLEIAQVPKERVGFFDEVIVVYLYGVSIIRYKMFCILL